MIEPSREGVRKLYYSKTLQDNVAKKLTEKANELGIIFQVKHTFKYLGSDYLVRIKKNRAEDESIKKFADHAFNTVVPEYANGVRFSYPTKI